MGLGLGLGLGLGVGVGLGAGCLQLVVAARNSSRVVRARIPCFTDGIPKSRKATPRSRGDAKETASGPRARTAAQLRRFIILKEKYEGCSVEEVRPVMARRIYAKMAEIEEALEECDAQGDGVVPVIELRNILDLYTIPVDDAVFHKLVRPFLLTNDDGDALVDSHTLIIACAVRMRVL